MIKPEEIKKRARRKYKNYLQSLITEVDFFPLVIPGDKKPSKTTNQFNQEIKALFAQSKEKKGFGYAITYELRKTKTLGTQSFPTQFSFETETDYLKYLGSEKEVHEFKNDYSKTIAEFPELKPWVLKNPEKLIRIAHVWDDVLKVCRYFKDNPQPNLYIRQLPVQVHTKFIEYNSGVIKELLDLIIADHSNRVVSKFEKRFNLRYAEPLVRFRILDESISNTYFQGIDDLSVPAPQFKTLQLPLNRVFIVENLMNALTLPFQKNSIVIFGKGFQASNIKEIEWLKTVEILYWGDLDVQGFEILSQVRKYYSHTRSMLMDQQTFTKFFENEKGTKSNVQNLEHLTPAEELLYLQLQTNNWRLEQEKIPDTYVSWVLADV